MRPLFLPVLLSLALPGTAWAQDLAGRAATDPNGFVREVQRVLSASGDYAGPETGQLDRATISAINRACREAGVFERCGLGPLSPEGAEAVAAAVGAKMVDPRTRVAWIPQGERNGITIAVSSEGTTYSATATGTAGADRWINIIGTEQLATTPGDAWTLTVSAAVDLAEGGEAIVGIAAMGPTGYVAEISPPLPVGTDLSDYTVSGIVPEGATSVVPYLQLRYPEGTLVNDTITLSGARILPEALPPAEAEAPATEPTQPQA